MASNRILLRVVGVAALLLCCKSDKKSDSDEAPTTAEGVVPAAPEEVASSAVPSTSPLSCSATLEEGLAASITVASVQDKEVVRFVVWAYLYKDGNHVGRVRVEETKSLAAGKSRSVHTKVPDIDADLVECEIGEVTFAGGLQWRNDNVVYAKAASRPLGGEAAVAGTAPVHVEWTGTTADPGHFKFENRSARLLFVTRAGVFFLDAEGGVIKRSIASVRAELAPSATVELGLGISAQRIPEGTDSIRVLVSEANFVDGDMGKWRDLNRERIPPEI